MALSEVWPGIGARLVKWAKSLWVRRTSLELFLPASEAHVGGRGFASLHGVTSSSISDYGPAFSEIMQGSAKSCVGSERCIQHTCVGSWSVAAFTSCGQFLHHFSGGIIDQSKSWQEAEETALEFKGGPKSPVIDVGSKLDEKGGLVIEKLGLEGTTTIPGKDQEVGGERNGKEKEGLGDIGKVCTECQVTKPLRNFERSISSPDGRHILCRACLAKFRTKRGGRALHHLATPVAEAWEKARVCTKCKHVQEMRDFCRDKSKKDGLAMVCRSCRGEYGEQLSCKPVAETAWCNHCGLKKPACKFSRIKGKKNGLHSTCTECIKAMWRETRRSGLPLKMYVQVQEKVCIACGSVKAGRDFYKDSLKIDGLQVVCKACRKSYQRAWRSRIQPRAAS